MDVLVYEYAVECYWRGCKSTKRAGYSLREPLSERKDEGGRKARAKTKGEIMK